MALTAEQRNQIKELLQNSLRYKFRHYSPEPAAMPFHTRLLGKDRLALYSFIHSLNTNFGTTFFEPVAKALGAYRFARSESQQSVGGFISSEAQLVIQRIIDDLSTAVNLPNKPEETEAIRAVCQRGSMNQVKLTKVDIKLVTQNGDVFLIDLKTAKPNAGGFKEFKRTMLEWVAATLAVDPQSPVHTLIAIPYNPYEPKPYSRWTMRGMLDLDHELKVAADFWDFLGGTGAYEDLLSIFENVGMELRTEIDDYFSTFRRDRG